MTRMHDMSNTKRRMRIAGLFYMIFIACSFAADYLASFALTDTDAVLRRILANNLFFRMGVSFNLLSALFFVLAAWALYELLRDTGRGLALLFLVLNAVGAAIQSVSSVFLLSASALAHNGGFAPLLNGVDSASLLTFFIVTYDSSFMSAQLFFSAWLLPLGILVYRSRILPRFLGILLMVDFVGILFWFFQHILAPDAKTISYPALIISVVAEFGLAFWLLFRRVKAEEDGKSR